MADTDWNAYPDTAYVDETDVFVAARGAGGVNVLGSAFVKKRSDGNVAIQKAGSGAQELILSLDAGALGFGSRDSQIRAGNNGSNQTYLDFYTSNAAAPAHAMRIAANGSVGIGTNNPLWKHHVLGAAVDLAGIISTSTSSGLLIGDSTAAIRLGTRSGNFIVDVGAERLRIDTAGNVGIGTASPSYKLHVGGSIAVGVDQTNYLFVGRYSAGYGGSVINTFGGSTFLDLQVEGNLALRTSTTASRPGADNNATLGAGSYRWSVAYSATGSINTSDEREKLWHGFSDELKAKVRRICRAMMEQLGFFQFLDQIEEKGEDGARWHFGVKAQYVWSLFAEEGLCAPLVGTGAEQRPDPAWQGPPPPAFLCWDIWEDRYEPVYEEQQIDTETVVIGQEPTGVFDQHGQALMRDVTEDRPIMGMVEVGQELKQAAGNRFGLRVDQLGLLLDWSLHERLAMLEAA